MVVTEDACSENFDLNDRLGTKYGGPNTERRAHGGVDIQADPGDRVLAWRDGTVTRVYNTDAGSPNYNGPCGHGVDIRHDNSWVSRYCHFQAPPALTVGATINAGALVGQVR